MEQVVGGKLLEPERNLGSSCFDCLGFTKEGKQTQEDNSDLKLGWGDCFVVKVLGTKSKDLNPLPGTHMVGREQLHST